MKDYYKTLGLKKDSSFEEIRDRYIRLVKIYHPDIKKDTKGDKRIKEINEAYEALKDDATRMEYDLRMLVDRASIRKGEKERKEFRLMKQAALSLFILFFFFFSFILWKKPSINIKQTSVVYHPITRISLQKPEPKAMAKEMVLIRSPRVNQERESGTNALASSLPAQKPDPLESEAKTKEVVSKESSIPIQVEAKRSQINATSTAQVLEKIAVSKPVTEIEKPSLIPEEKPKPDLIVVKEPRKDVSLETLKPVLMASASKPDPPLISKVEPNVTLDPHSPSPMIEDEVRQFLKDYIDHYARKDIQSFIALFSPKAIQNGKEGLEKIREIYLRFFEQSERLFYRLEDMKVSISGSNAEVRGYYQLSQGLKNRGGEKLWKGNIRWGLVKEDGILRIISLDYQNEKSP